MICQQRSDQGDERRTHTAQSEDRREQRHRTNAGVIQGSFSGQHTAKGQPDDIHIATTVRDPINLVGHGATPSLPRRVSQVFRRRPMARKKRTRNCSGGIIREDGIRNGLNFGW